MTHVLPAGFRPLPFNPAGSLPQQVQAQAGGRALSVTLVAMTADLVGTLAPDRTRLVVDGTEEEAPRNTIVDDPRAGFTAAPPQTLGSAAVRPYLVVLDAGRVIGSAPVVIGRPMPFGTSEGSGLVMEILFLDLRLAAGSLVEPADVGSRILAGYRERGTGGPLSAPPGSAGGREPR
ncbi:hypothetical protein [Streptomyces sp. DASNCL29]|uniref:hypothetical protein n=1 Tax=Streptomyces sp. DASNCL29 TaxID=2583819 RepID=UPI00110FC7AB|nr:hypothetical protein [Streptomyces sp. DASNCL29]TMV00045.1 hypothetical protein FGK60_21850 [Streptomyces sp. DASNCL29]